ncbi:hypothetical protein [Alicyclobacillus sp. SO9]|uniref:hypothetical protein n=1 Tax=Alicyclobacillus sp. SO9 TaxID=2665646 RepID=UPI0018E854CD|nr:hypothetical protein [Alicyclobacillus sp. SO9]QQE79640.1 hypothetical protein GI364_03875 [Alicyclobacillus sp. SO9]
MQQQLDEVLNGAKKEYSLQEIVDAIKGDATDYSDTPGEHMSLHIEYRPRTLTFIYMDSEPDVEKYRCNYGLVINQDGTVHSVKIDGTELNKNQIMNGFHGSEKLLFQAYATKATLVGYQDEDEIDTSYDNEED